jgi:hypothetical protein
MNGTSIEIDQENIRLIWETHCKIEEQFGIKSHPTLKQFERMIYTLMVMKTESDKLYGGLNAETGQR